MIRKVGIIMAKDNTQQQNTQQKIKSILYSNDNAQQMVPRYKIQETLFSVGNSTTNNISYNSYWRTSGLPGAVYDVRLKLNVLLVK